MQRRASLDDDRKKPEGETTDDDPAVDQDGET
jgi:hypothetical protein